jgi:adenylate cyclase
MVKPGLSASPACAATRASPNAPSRAKAAARWKCSASRLEHEAPPGEVVISYETYAHVQDEVHCEEHGNIRVRGIAYPVTTYRVVDLKINLAAGDVAIRTQLPNLRLELKPHLMSADERGQAIAALRQAIERLSN